MNIKQVFDSPKYTTRNPALLAKRANTSLKAAESFLRDQAPAQMRKEHRNPDKTNYVPTGGDIGTYLADIMYLKDYAGVNKKRSCILTLMEINSRFVYARALISATAAHTAEAFESIYNQNKRDAESGNVSIIDLIRSDDGPEFRGSFEKLLEHLKIPVIKCLPNRHARMSRLDRYHSNLRKQIGDLFAARNSHVWIDSLDDMVYNHNTSPSSAFKSILKERGISEEDAYKVTPSSLTPRDELILMMEDMGRANKIRARVDKLDIKPGTKVRLLTSMLKNTPKFIKGQESVWTPDIYKILERVGPNTFKVDVLSGENEVWPVHSLQVVNKSLNQAIAGEKINKKNVKETRQLNLEISEKEREANIAAPLRNRSERAPKVDYKKMMK